MHLIPTLFLMAPPAAALEPGPGLHDIPMGQVFEALAGLAPPPHPRVVEPPPQLRSPSPVPSPFPDKQVYGGRMDHWVDSANFTVAWNGGDASQAEAELASGALEAAWQALVEDRGWTLPVSSDRFLLWVVLEPTLGGTGLTTEYTSIEFPDGYPVIYLNPTHAPYTQFFESLCAHELSHALQFALRDWDVGDQEAWYWEASAEWMAELARPELEAYAQSSYYYSTQPGYRFDSTENYHQYGMFPLNAAVEELMVGDGAVRAVWELSAERTGEPWHTILAEALGRSEGEIWAVFTGAMGNGTLSESSLYTAVQDMGFAGDGLEGELPMLGTDYYEIPRDCSVTVEPTVAGDRLMLAGPHDFGTTISLREGEFLAVTGLTEPTASYRLTLGELAFDSGDTGLNPDKERGGCSCGGGAHAAWLGLFGLPWALHRRRGQRSRKGSTHAAG